MINPRASILLIISCSALGIMVVTNYLTFEQTAFAVDKCDSSSNCTNTPGTGMGGNNQNNECTNSSTCENILRGNDNTQSNQCDSVEICFNNIVAGDDNTQKVDCTNGQCGSDVIGDKNSIQIDCTDTTCASLLAGNTNIQNTNCIIVSAGCTNSAHGDGNSQSINCKSGEGGCSNAGFGDGNTQTIKCNSVGSGGCRNSVVPFNPLGSNNDNTQDMKCLLVKEGCLNSAQGDGNNQNLLCIKSTQCSNEIDSPTTGNTQKSVCINSGTCQNDGTDTKVISVKSDSCKNDDVAGSKTICVNNRIIHRP